MKRAHDDRLRYEVVRSRRSTADIVIERDGSIVVRAPEWADDQRVARIVASKHLWIFRTLAERQDLHAARVPREFKSGEGFLYLGRSYRLLLVGRQHPPLLLRDGRFALSRALVARGGPRAAKAAFRDYYVSRGRERIRERVACFAPKVGVTPKVVDVRDLGHRWASCSATGRLAFHWKCMMAPQTIVDYIVVHELCHFHQRDHSDAFWNEIDKVMPDFRDRKEWLRRNGAGLDV